MIVIDAEGKPFTLNMITRAILENLKIKTPTKMNLVVKDMAVAEDGTVPENEVLVVDRAGNVVTRIVNVAAP